MAIVALIFLFASRLAAATPSGFEAASVRLSASSTGQDAVVTMEPGRLIARNTTLKRLMFEAWQLPYAQMQGGPSWSNDREYDVEAVAQRAATTDELRLMLQALLLERFSMKVHTETRPARVYVLTVLARGGKLQGAGGTPPSWRFHGDMNEFANVLAIQLTIPLLNDAATPSRSRGAALPVLNKTGIEGKQDIALTIRPDQGGDAFTVWQRALREQLGLALESRRTPVEFLVVDKAEKVPLAN
jgi:uncharacterized protein (TIGR03435 family)